MEKPFNFSPDPSQEVDAVNETSSSSETSSEEESFLSYLRREAREEANATQMKKTPEFAEQVLLPGEHILGACAGSKHAVGVNSECIPNIEFAGADCQEKKTEKCETIIQTTIKIQKTFFYTNDNGERIHLRTINETHEMKNEEITES